jgi:hypothetical protein
MMADILAILPGITLDALEAMSLSQLGDWHTRAVARAPKREG